MQSHLWRHIATVVKATAGAFSLTFLVYQGSHSTAPTSTRCEEAIPPPSMSSTKRMNTKQELEKIRRNKTKLYQQWVADEEGWRELPARAWPAFQPNPQQLESIQHDIAKLKCQTTHKNEKNNTQKTCERLLFDMATTLVFYSLDPNNGFEQYQRLAKLGHVDAMVACGIILIEGIAGVKPRETEGIQWLEKAVSLGSAQACYELGVVYYTGIDGVVDEDTTKAYSLFEQAAMAENHTAALYMMADCLLEGDGVPEKSVAQAVPLLHKAADRGHRYARQKIRELLSSGQYQG